VRILVEFFSCPRFIRIKPGIADAPHFRHEGDVRTFLRRFPAKGFRLVQVGGNIIAIRLHLQQRNMQIGSSDQAAKNSHDR
jgi:hypothetical protein